MVAIFSVNEYGDYLGAFVTDLAVWTVCEVSGPFVTTTFIHLKCSNCNACQKVRKQLFLYTA